MKRVYYFRFILVFVTSAFLSLMVFGCGSSRQGVGLESDELIGEESAEFGTLGDAQEASADLKSEEDEVLRLLGITKEQKPDTQQISTTDEYSDAPVEEQISKMQEELTKRDSEITSLRTDLANKEHRIDNLEQNVKTPQVPGLSPSIAPIDKTYYKTRYQEGLQFYNARNYRQGIEIFESLLATDMKHSLADNAQYWIGECYYGLGNFSQGIVEFEKVFSFAKKDKYDDSLLKVGLCYLRLGERAKAKSEFERLISEFPESEYVDKANLYLSKL